MNKINLTQRHGHSLEKRYQELAPLLECLIDPKDHTLSVLANITAFLKQSFEKISWAGFYILENGRLYLGPFQGNVACTSIAVGKGVCGAAVAQSRTIIVDDVNQFPGHIACDAGSKSEIVVPVPGKEKIYGVLDIDSHEKAAFGVIDKKYLERYCRTLALRMDL